VCKQLLAGTCTAHLAAAGGQLLIMMRMFKGVHSMQQQQQ
jgi:hypothetical protein